MPLFQRGDIAVWVFQKICKLLVNTENELARSANDFALLANEYHNAQCYIDPETKIKNRIGTH
jgi:hypothetical protein